jgi:hypothetical protein
MTVWRHDPCRASEAPLTDIPGNLIVHGDLLVSQSATEIAAYPLRNSSVK